MLTAASRITLVGVPWDASSSFQRGAAAAPAHIRAALWSASTNTSTELGIAIEREGLADAGDLRLPDEGAAARAIIEAAIAGVLAHGGVPFALGGDHSISYPVLRAFRASGPVTILHVDAHGDLYDQFPLPAAGDPPDTLPDRYSHACPFARIMEEGLCRHLVQVGIRTMTPHLRAQASRFGVEVYGPDACADVPAEALEGPLYVSLDLDGLDPAFAPGVAHPEPGGLSVREVVRLLHRIRAPIVGVDVVELNPDNDVRDLTARVAAKLLKEAAAVAIRNGRP
ncbi:MAG: arginase family protein [Acidobacteriota bacterium]